jgi:hypothetical protein
MPGVERLHHRVPQRHPRTQPQGGGGGRLERDAVDALQAELQIALICLEYRRSYPDGCHRTQPKVAASPISR